MNGYQLLANAIVEQAANDYVDLLAGFIHPENKCTISYLEHFFHSQWYTELTDLDPDYLIQRLRRKAERMKLKYTISKEKGSHKYFVHAVESKTAIPGTLGSKKRALHKAAELNELDYKDYMRVRRREGVNHD